MPETTRGAQPALPLTSDSAPAPTKQEMVLINGRKFAVHAIPAGTKGRLCNGPHCDETIYYIDASITRAPLSCEAQHGGAHPTRTAAGRGHSHFATCPDARQFSKLAPRKDGAQQ